jgi:2-polyprenyl-6-methoxyphenol hydroxylase-like FAD-dependent oxidoreductase
MRNVVVEKWYKDNVFIIGDAAHQYPPSGGYGLNTGVADAFALAWRLKYIVDGKEQLLKETFEKERIIHSSVNFNFTVVCVKMR